MPIDLTKPAASSSLSSAVIRAQFAEVAAELALKLDAANPSFTGDITGADGGGFVSGIGGTGGYVFVQGNGATPDKKPQYDWYNYGSVANEHLWMAWADVSSLHEADREITLTYGELQLLVEAHVTAAIANMKAEVVMVKIQSQLNPKDSK
jgi:hypothetical protein